MAEDSEEAARRKELEAEERKKQSHDLVAESIRRELLESARQISPLVHRFDASVEEKEEEVIDVDDTDGVDASAEFDAWRLRELARIKRDKEAEIAREQEREEVERRRALPEEQRLKEDLEHAKNLREEKPKGKQMFLQKYWHKGAFHQVCSSSTVHVHHPPHHIFVGSRHSQATRLHRGDGIDGGCLSPSTGYAGKKFWQTRTDKVYPLGRSRHHCGKWWIWRCWPCQSRRNEHGKWGMLPLWRPTYEKRYLKAPSDECFIHNLSRLSSKC